jgi:uncharacterized protein (TIGR03000 family)
MNGLKRKLHVVSTSILTMTGLIVSADQARCSGEGHGGGAGHAGIGGYGGHGGYGGYGGRGYGYGRYGYGYGGYGFGYGFGLGLGLGYYAGYPYYGYPYYGYPYAYGYPAAPYPYAYPGYAPAYGPGYGASPPNADPASGPAIPPIPGSVASAGGIAIPAPRSPDTDVTLIVRIPADATVWINGVKTTQTGSRREFVSSGLAPGRSYTFDVRAQWVSLDGKPVDLHRKIAAQAGERRTVDFSPMTPLPGAVSANEAGVVRP